MNIFKETHENVKYKLSEQLELLNWQALYGLERYIILILALWTMVIPFMRSKKLS